MTELDPETLSWLQSEAEHALQMLARPLNRLHGLVLAEAVCEAHPEPPAALVAQRDQLRARPPANWRVIAWEEGVWRHLFRVAAFARGRGHRAEVVDVFERWAVELSETRYPGMQPGHIDWTAVSPVLRARKRTIVKAHPSGHLAQVTVAVDKLHHGELVLAESPGEGTLRITEGRDGKPVTTEEIYARPQPWTKWVHASLDRLAHLVSAARTSRSSATRASPTRPTRASPTRRPAARRRSRA